MAPGGPTTVRFRAEIDFQRAEYDQAIETLRGFAKKANLSPAEWKSRFETAGAMLEKFAERLQKEREETAAAKFISAAEDLWREAARREPDQELRLAEFLVRQGRLAEALGLAQQNWQTYPLDAVLRFLGTILNSSRCDSPQLPQIEELTSAALNKHGRKSALLDLAATYAPYKGGSKKPCPSIASRCRNIMTPGKPSTVWLFSWPCGAVISRRPTT